MRQSTSSGQKETVASPLLALISPLPSLTLLFMSSIALPICLSKVWAFSRKSDLMNGSRILFYEVTLAAFRAE